MVDSRTKRRCLIPRTAPVIRTVIFGLGKMGGYHAAALRDLAAGRVEPYYKSGLSAQVVKVRTVGVCDPDPRTRGVCPEALFFSDSARLLESVDADISIIAAPTTRHYELARASLNAGLHTFVEKPAVTRAAEWEALHALAVCMGVRVMAGHVERYNPVSIRIRSLMRDDSLRISSYRFSRCQPPDPRIPDDILIDKLIHDLDLALFLFGEITDFHLLDARPVQGRVQEVRVGIEHAGGVTGELFISWLRPFEGKVRRCVLTLADGREAVGDFLAKRLWLAGNPVRCSVPGWIEPDNNQIKDELADFLGYCLEPDPSYPPVAPLLPVAEIAEGVRILESLAGSLCTEAGVNIHTPKTGEGT